MEEKEFKSALKVQEGIEQPSKLNNAAIDRMRNTKKPAMEVSDYTQGILSGNRTVLGQAITLIESSLPEHHVLAQEVLRACLPHTGKSLRIGITGVPGVGKSTFIEAFGKYLTAKGHHVAVLAIDPSSQRSKGSILGDKTRMERLANDPNAFIRPSPSAGSLGGVARKTQETLLLCEAAGFDRIIIETVGVGQSETSVHSMVDFFLLLMLSGAGDELQGIKRGIMEMADAIVINKADGDNIQRARLAKAEYANALHLFAPAPSGWTARVETCSAMTGEGINEVLDIISEYQQLTLQNGYFAHRRMEQARETMIATVDDSLKQEFYENAAVKTLLPDLENELENSRISSYVAARQLMDAWLQDIQKKD
jgi:LAO/AO transport system kinase